ncbi:RNase adapter RapZ [Alteriqipengyuania flavescens]|uniref:RNase adapter RapZ n=1 Tax=Alteriqipengyuania flavescens TaxID=3053610 RepID=UPI0025B30ADD|nr:RNase adapter RapZ [Alteriqipengyuania flavescens]WJY18873.1 RNase adapter RapZ [Alteriqipengyuania flavescens]WJY24813.1 RNase adapter RapZ [Alteriqipengyuania flavescens]
MVSDSTTALAAQPILLVTGLSGAGKTTALRELEDLGWETIDNFPIRLLKNLVSGKEADEHRAPLAIGFDARTRGFVPAQIIELVKTLSARPDLEISTLYIDCDDAELERRYNENRRRHPLADGVPVTEAIGMECELLAPLRRWADLVITTTKLSTNALQETIRERFAGATEDAMVVTVTSFGFARGMPPVADLVFDMRYLDNPHWVEGLREQTGLDEAVARHIQADPAFDETFPQICHLVLDLLPRYRDTGKRYATIAFGCTGGRHRSVYSAERMAAALRDEGFEPTVVHRNLGSRAAGLVEGSSSL